MRTLLLKRYGGLGDMVMLTAAVYSLRKSNPNIKVILLTAPYFVNLFKGLPIYEDVTAVAPPNFPKEDTLELTGSVEAGIVGGYLPFPKYMMENRIDIFEEVLGVTEHPKEKHLMINVSKTALDRVKKKVNYGRWDRSKFYIALQVTCATYVRALPPEHLFALSDILTNTKFRLIYTGGESWLPPQVTDNLRNGINMIDKLDLEEYIALMSISDGVIAPDSSGPHVAAALKKKCLALFGNIDPYTRVHYYPTVKALYPKGEIPCIPCGDNAYSNCHRSKYIGGMCMRRLDPIRILNAMEVAFK